MANTVPNQKTILIHKERPRSDFMQIANAHWMDMNKKYGPYALQLYLYLAKNADGFSLALSPQAAKKEAGICKTSFHKYLDLLIEKGYLVWEHGNTYSFFETPYGKGLPDGKPVDGQESLREPPKSLRGGQSDSADNREIDNIDKINSNKDKVKTKEVNSRQENTFKSGMVEPFKADYVF